MRHVSLLFFVLTMVLAAGCPAESEPNSGGCGPLQACAGDLVCQEGTCLARCQSVDDCESGICDIGTGLCLECLSNEDCGNGLVCNQFTNRCVVASLGCTNDAECGDLRCDTAKGACVDCLGASDCAAGAQCDIDTATCITPQGCGSDSDCSDSVCDPNKSECVECYTAAHCASGVCDTITSTCVIVCTDNDLTEPNDADNATTLADGGEHEGTICPDDVDEFLIDAEGTLTARLIIDGSAALQVKLFNAAGALMASSTANGNGAVLTSLDLLAASYRLVVSGVSSGDAADYLLSADVEQPIVCAQLDLEPNDTSAQAIAVAADNALHTGSICDTDIDLFSFTALAGDDVEAAAIAGDGAGALVVAILSSTGAVVASGNPATLDNVEAGTFFVRVTATGGDVGYSVRVSASNVPSVCTQTDAEPNDLDAQALSLTAGSTAIGTICPGDIDQHRFAASELDDVSVTVQGTGLSARLLRASDGIEVASGLTMNISDVSGGGYRIVIAGSSATSQESYTVRVTLTPEPVPDVCDEGTIEPDARSNARALAVDGTPQTGRICALDTDFFSFTLPFDSTVTVRARFIGSLGDLDMQLTDADGDIIDTSLGYTDDEVIVQALPAGSYGVEMFGYLDAANTYTMEATLAGCTPDDAFEQNNTVAFATPIGSTLVSAARCPADDDFFLVRLEEGDVMAATLIGADLTFSLVSAIDGVLLASDAESGGSRHIDVSGLPAGRYVLRVTGASADRVPYTLTPGITPADGARCIDDGAHPNDTPSTAFALDGGGLLDGSYEVGVLVSCEFVDFDWFTLPLPGQKQVTVQLAFDATRDVDIELVEPRGNEGFTRTIARSYATDKQDRLTGVVNAGGTFFLKAVGFDEERTQYGIGIEIDDPPLSSCTDDRFDTWLATSSGTLTDVAFTNDEAADAVTVSSGEVFNTLRVCPSNADWFKINAAVGETIVVHIDYAHELNRDIDVRLYGPDSQATFVSDSDGTDGAEDISFTATETGDHFIEVFGYAAGENSYDMTTTLE